MKPFILFEIKFEFLFLCCCVENNLYICILYFKMIQKSESNKGRTQMEQSNLWNYGI